MSAYEMSEDERAWWDEWEAWSPERKATYWRQMNADLSKVYPVGSGAPEWEALFRKDAPGLQRGPKPVS